ncbi:MAG TPA: dihydrofolate reductase family protein [Solirubrobacteraceae bacterium]|nr:dihydrofolate reductase family protein [Solirubrobacteraceae bacterium]
MGRLIVSTHMTLDGAIDSTERWFIPHQESEQHGFNQLRAAAALVLGRKTYEGLAGVWPDMTDDTGFAEQVNSIPKFVASRTLQAPLEWNATLLEGDLAERLSALKRESDGNLLMYGCGELAHELIQHGLVDELQFWVNPVVLGGDDGDGDSGERPFHGRGPVALELVSSTAFGSGVVLLSYRPVG